MRINKSWRPDLRAGALVALMALPLCLGIAMASGYPMGAGVVTAVVGGLLVTPLGSAGVTIKGPAAGLIAIALGAALELGYGRALAAGVMAGAVQVLLALVRAGRLGDAMPANVVHGMLAAIGVLIIGKQGKVALGWTEAGVDWRACAVGLVSLGILFLAPRRVPGPLAVLAAAIPLGLALGMGGGQMVRLPESFVAFPEFAGMGEWVFWKYVTLFALVGSVESMLSVAAVEALDGEKRKGDWDRDLLATGIGNMVAAGLGGLPMISEIVRSKANLDAGARTGWSNFYHGLLLLGAVVLAPGLLERIPLAALAALLVYTGTRLASPREFLGVWRVGPEQLAVFLTTMGVTLATDLLAGVAAGLAVEFVVHAARVRFGVGRLLRAEVTARRAGEEWLVEVREAAVFSNFAGLRGELEGRERVRVDFAGARVVDHTVLKKLAGMEGVEVTGLDRHAAWSGHALATRWRE
jgi:MFS superfamily sulfate permease-like transporter